MQGHTAHPGGTFTWNPMRILQNSCINIFKLPVIKKHLVYSVNIYLNTLKVFYTELSVMKGSSLVGK